MLSTIGIIGCGNAAQTLHFPALARIPGLTLAAADVDEANLRAVAARFGITRTVQDYHALLADPTIEAVAILTPPATHVAIGLEALAAGKAVLFEKPLALTLADCDRLIAADDGRAAVGFNLRSHRLIQRAKAALKAIGPLQAVQSIFVTPAGGADWRRQTGAGGDPLSDLGSHHFDLWRTLFDADIDSVQAVRSEAGAVAVAARLSNGLSASGLFAKGTAVVNRVEIFGTRGRISVSVYRFDGLRIVGTNAPVAGARFWMTEARAFARALPKGITTFRSGGDIARSYAEQWRAFLNGERTLATLEDGKRALAAVLAAEDSTHSGRAVPVMAAS